MKKKPNVTEVVQKYRNINNQIIEDEAKIEINNHYIKIYKLENSNKEEIEELQAQNKIFQERIDKNRAKLNKKERYFSISIADFIGLLCKKFQSDYPDKKVQGVFELLKQEKHVCEDFYGDTYNYYSEYEFGAEIPNEKKWTFKYNYPSRQDAVGMAINGHINLLKAGYLNKNSEFASEEWQDIFWGLFEDEINASLTRLEKDEAEEKKKLKNRYAKEYGDLLK